MSENSKSNGEQKVLQCLYCGNKTLMNLVGEHKSDWDEDEWYYGYYLYQMFCCPICNRVTFHEIYWDNTQSDYNHNIDEIVNYVNEKILFPTNSIETEALPSTIKNSYESALKTRNIDNDVCLLALRRTLELICIDKQATKWGLKDKIEELAQKGVFPEVLKEASIITKYFGDSAAHASELDVNIQDISIMIDFVEYIIEYLYILPYKLDMYKNRLDLIEKNKKSDKLIELQEI